MTLVKCPHCSRAYPPYDRGWRGWSVDLSTNCALSPSGVSIKLEGREAIILAALLAEGGGVVSRERLYLVVWGRWSEGVYETLRTRIDGLRKKLRPHGAGVINTSRVGYAIAIQESKQEHAA